MKYTTKRCPHCWHAYKILSTGDQLEYGSPLLVCPKCSKSYYDSDIIEPALYGYDNVYEKRKASRRWHVVWLLGVLAVASLITAMRDMYSVDIGMSGFLFFGILIIVAVASIKSNDAREREDIGFLAKKRIAYDESLERLQNTEYLKALAKIDTKASALLKERLSGAQEHYAPRP